MCGYAGVSAGAMQPGMQAGGASVPPDAAAGVFGPQLQARQQAGVFGAGAPPAGRERIAQMLIAPPQGQPQQMPLAQQLQMQRRAQMQGGMPSMGTPDDFVSRTPRTPGFDPMAFFNTFRRR
jgi:hypothetical protein